MPAFEPSPRDIANGVRFGDHGGFLGQPEEFAEVVRRVLKG
ncbi:MULTISPECIES: hypothetical protein [unclassified Streptomyces]|uniref:Alpha/beta hydrolase n=1 Tax=Streptomyces sp. NBC_00060 TaxID=2975636 RepID=A0AAU2H8H8_9ACTN